jgi:hypothetical protein
MKPIKTEQKLLDKLNGKQNWIIRFFSADGRLLKNEYANNLTKEEADELASRLVDIVPHCESVTTEKSK